MKKQTQLTMQDRELLLKLVAQGFSQRDIANKLGKNQSTISRELRRGGKNRNTYSIAVAQVDRNQKASLKGAQHKLVVGNTLHKFVREKIVGSRWSPEQVSGYLKRDKRSKQISYETIYCYIYSLEDPAEKAFWTGALRQKRKKRRSRKCKNGKRGQILNRVSIHSRPESINERVEGGHWEGDLVIGKDHASAIGTLVERVSKLTRIVEVPGERTSDKVVAGFSSELMNIPCSLRKSLTYDNGHEMAEHQVLSATTGMSVFFADPGCPGQRGTNENTNGLIRDYFPKGTDFSKVSREELKRVERELNQRPRKSLDYATPEEVFRGMMKKSKPPDKTARPERGGAAATLF
jgi:IS30 family transposase